jgi:uroporphyrin-III C-methyltransferase
LEVKCKGKVYIVGAGPGDPELATVKAVRLIREADVIVYDRLIPRELLAYAKPEAKLVYAGKEPGKHTLTQDEINKLLLAYACEGKMVIRLHGGDPTIFGRGEEECYYLTSHGVSCEFVPGVTSAFAAPELACIPPTSRWAASSVAVVTGREAEGKRERRVRYGEIAKAVDTLIILMGVGRLEQIVGELLESGVDPSTPVAIVERAATSQQRVITGRLSNIVELSRRENVRPPAVIVIGRVVELRDKICPARSREYSS